MAAFEIFGEHDARTKEQMARCMGVGSAYLVHRLLMFLIIRCRPLFACGTGKVSAHFLLRFTGVHLNDRHIL